MLLGAPTPGGPLLASLGIPSRPIQTHLDIKHLLTFRINGMSPLSLFPNFNANQAEAHYKGHKHARKLRALESARHKQKARGRSRDRSAQPTLDIKKQTVNHPADSQIKISVLSDLDEGHSPLPTPEPASADHEEECASPEVEESAPEPLDTGELVPVTAYSPGKGSEDSCVSTQDSEKERKNREHLYCTTCKVTVNSTSQLEAHNAGAKHKSILEGQSTHPRRGRGKALSRSTRKPKRIGNKASVGIQNKAYHCPLCEIHVNSETQLKQHMSSRRHKDRLAGKPPKPKYSPFSKLQKNAALATRLALHKHLTKTLAAHFLPSPFSQAAVCTLPSPLSLRPATAAALFQTPIFGPALFRSPPTALRPASAPIMFAPY